jgi:hypothetical protein
LATIKIMKVSTHPHVTHPKELLKKDKVALMGIAKWNDRVLDWISNHVLASIWLFDVALIVPLFTITAPNSVKITLGVISGSWIQWWALPALQRSGNKTQAQNDAKMDADYTTLTYLATLQDEQLQILRELKDKNEAT